MYPQFVLQRSDASCTSNGCTRICTLHVQNASSYTMYDTCRRNSVLSYGCRYDLEHALMVLTDLKMMELEPNNALQQCQSDIKSAHMDFEANESLVRWHSYQQFDEPVKDDDADDQVYALPT